MRWTAKASSSGSVVGDDLAPGGLTDEHPALIRRLAAQIKQALPNTPYDLIFIDDGSTDDSWQVINDLNAADPAARAHLQDDPADLPKLLEKIDADLDVVVGWKVERSGC
jgi:dolichol-phosphate mannosyltransferase